MGYPLRYLFYVCYVLILCSGCVCEEEALRCYSCHFENQPADCRRREESCGHGHTCQNVVYKRPLLGTVYTKGCLDRDECHRLQSLNRDRYCGTVPSECVYCCDENLCNDAHRVMTSYLELAIFVVMSATSTNFVTQLM